jgi:hypothetical protein
MQEPNWASWLRPTQAAVRLEVSGQRVRQLMDTGDLVTITTPLGRLVDPASVEAYRLKREARRRK